MKKYSFLTLVIVMISFIAMGCNEDSSNESPRAELILEPPFDWIYDNETGIVNPEITFNATGSSDPDGEVRNYHYEFGEGNFTDNSDNTYSRTYQDPGYFNPSLTVQDNDGDEDMVSRILIVNYQYLRTNQPLEATAGTSSESEHPFPISGYHPFSGAITVEINAPEFENPNANVTVYNEDGEQVAFEEEENISGNVTVVINLDSQDFEDFGTGQWKVVVAVENGSVTYDITIGIIYKK